MGAKESGLDLNSDMLSDNLLVSLNDRTASNRRLGNGLWAFPLPNGKRRYNHLVLCKHTFDSNQQPARRQLKARVFYDEGHVQNIELNLASKDSSHCIVNSNCLPSIPT